MEWNDIPPAERFELVATIREMRAWRYGDNPPLRPLPPVQQSALALHQWLTRTCNKGRQGELLTVDRQRSEPWEGSARSTLASLPSSKPQGELFS